MAWLHEHGIISGYPEYRRLPAGVLEDARLIAEGEMLAQQQRERKRRG